MPTRPPLWTVSNALARIMRLLGAFLPRVNDKGAARALRCRPAVASTLLAGL